MYRCLYSFKQVTCNLYTFQHVICGKYSSEPCCAHYQCKLRPYAFKKSMYNQIYRATETACNIFAQEKVLAFLTHTHILFIQIKVVQHFKKSNSTAFILRQLILVKPSPSFLYAFPCLSPQCLFFRHFFFQSHIIPHKQLLFLGSDSSPSAISQAFSCLFLYVSIVLLSR